MQFDLTTQLSLKKIANSTIDKKVVSSKCFELFALSVCHLSHCNCLNLF